MSDEAAFLRTILADPSDDAVRLVYADWLDEQWRHNQAEFLRITATSPPTPPAPSFWARAAAVIRQESIRPRPDPRLPRLRELAALLDTNWLAIVSRTEVEECEAARQRSTRDMFRFVCDRDWADLTATEDTKVRHCDACHKDVHFCDTITEAREHSRQRHCIAVDVAIVRREGDLIDHLCVLGEPSDESIEEALAHEEPDPVSAARQRRKEAGGG